jgi:hypothetical protein
MRRARARRLAAVAVVWVSQLVCWRSRRQAGTRWGMAMFRRRPRRVLGGGDQRVELSLGVAGGLDRGAAGRQPDLERCSVPAARGWASWSRPNASRAALVASRGSDLAPWRRVARLGRSSSTTRSALA